MDGAAHLCLSLYLSFGVSEFIVQELCRGGRPGLSVLTSLMVSVNEKQY